MTKTVFNFTKALLNALPIPAEGKRLEVRDVKVPGLLLRVTSNGVKTFCVRKRVKGGAPERITLKRFPDMTIEVARAEARVFLGQLAAGTSVAEVRRSQKGEYTFTSLFEDYIERHAKHRKRTWQEDQAKFDMHLKAPLGTRKLSSITRRDVAAIHSKITKAGHPIAANRVVALVSSVFGFADRAGITSANPAKSIARNAETKRDRFLQKDELPRFFEAMNAEPKGVIRDYLMLSLLTGARRANVLAMHSSELNLDAGEWRIPRTKNNDPQTVALVPEAVAIIRQRKFPPGGGFVLPGPGKNGHLAEPRKGWVRVLDRAAALGFVRAIAKVEEWTRTDLAEAEAGALANPNEEVAKYAAVARRHKIDPKNYRLTDLRIHDLRRTLGSWQAKTGASLSVIGKSLNHKNVSTTAIYARLDHDPIRESVGKATDAMLEAGGLKQKAAVVALAPRGGRRREVRQMDLPRSTS